MRSATWRMNGRFAPQAALGETEIQLPLYPRKLTQSGNRGMSEKCSERKSNSAKRIDYLNATALSFGKPHKPQRGKPQW